MNQSNTKTKSSKKSKLSELKLFFEELPNKGRHPATKELLKDSSNKRLSRRR